MCCLFYKQRNRSGHYPTNYASEPNCELLRSLTLSLGFFNCTKALVNSLQQRLNVIHTIRHASKLSFDHS